MSSSQCCLLLTDATQFCSLNFTSSDLALVADIDHVTIHCHISYLAAYQWTPYIQCLPNITGQTEVINETPGNVTYARSFSATPEIDGVVLSCVAKFNATGYNPSKEQADNAPQDVHLWTSEPLRVQCTQLFCVITC